MTGSVYLLLTTNWKSYIYLILSDRQGSKLRFPLLVCACIEEHSPFGPHITRFIKTNKKSCRTSYMYLANFFVGGWSDPLCVTCYPGGNRYPISCGNRPSQANSVLVCSIDHRM